MLAKEMGRKMNKYVEDYVIFDLETTGVSYKKDEVIEISAIKVIKGEVVDKFSTLVDPGIPIPHYATEVNNITDNMVKGAPSMETALKDILPADISEISEKREFMKRIKFLFFLCILACL